MGILVALLLALLGFWVLIKLLPLILRLFLYCLIALPIWIVCLLLIPGPIDEGALFLFLLVIAIGKASSDSGYGGGYVLNKKSKVIHPLTSNSVASISDKHRKVLSSSEAFDLIGRGGKYRFKK